MNNDHNHLNRPLGKDDDAHRRTVHLIDFGLSSTMATNAINPTESAASSTSWSYEGGTFRGASISSSSSSRVSGTLDFSSSRVLRGGAPADPRDDLESLAYCLLYLLRGSLPWGDVSSSTESGSDLDPDLDLSRTAEKTAAAKDACLVSPACLAPVWGTMCLSGGGCTPVGASASEEIRAELSGREADAAVAERYIRKVLTCARSDSHDLPHRDDVGRLTISNDLNGSGRESSVLIGSPQGSLPPLRLEDYTYLR